MIAPEWYFLPFYGVIRAIPHKALGILVMAVLIVCLGLVWSAAGTGASAASRTSLIAASRASSWLWVLDMACLSVICLQVNHAESLYWVLVASFVGTLAWSIGGFAGLTHAGSVMPRLMPICILLLVVA